MYQFIDGYENVYTPYNTDVYDDVTVRTCIDTIARHAAKLKPTHIRRQEGKTDHINSNLNYLLSVRPNDFIPPMILFTSLLVSYTPIMTCLFIYKYDDTGTISGLYPLSHTSVKPIEYHNELYVKFRFYDGNMVTVPYTQLIHIRRHYNNNYFFGDSTDNALKPSLTLLQTLKQGLVNLVKNSKVIWIH